MRLHLVATTVAYNQDLREAWEAYHLSHGVERIWTAPSLPHEQQGEAMTQLQRQAHEAGADWVLDSDDDLFWWADGGDLRRPLAHVSASVGALRVPATEYDLSGARAYAGRLSWHGHAAGPHCAHRPSPSIRLNFGGTLGLTDRGRIAPAQGLECLHWPLRSEAQALEKCRTLMATEFGPGPRPRPPACQEAYEDMAQDPDGAWARIRALPTVPDDRLMRCLEMQGLHEQADRHHGQ